MNRLSGLLVVVALVAGCTRPAPQSTAGTDPATRRQRDSAVARMPVPGARAVDRALGVLEASQARADALDSIH